MGGWKLELHNPLKNIKYTIFEFERLITWLSLSKEKDNSSNLGIDLVLKLNLNSLLGNNFLKS